MRGKYFLDTNICAYFLLSNEPESLKKHKIARDLLEKALYGKRGCISLQVVQEFSNIYYKSSKHQDLDSKDLRLVIQHLLEPICHVYPDMNLCREAAYLKDETSYHYYDCLIIAAAIKAECVTLYSEDLQDGQVIRGLKIQNPF